MRNTMSNHEAQLTRIAAAPLLAASEGDDHGDAIFLTTEATSDALNALTRRIEAHFPGLPEGVGWIIADLAMVAALTRLSAKDALALAASPEGLDVARRCHVNAMAAPEGEPS